MKQVRRRVVLIAASLTLGAASTGSALGASPPAAPSAEGQEVAVAAQRIVGWATDLWSKASTGQTDSALSLLGTLPDGATDVGLGTLAKEIGQYSTNIEARESARAERIAEVREELGTFPELLLIDAIRDTIELHTLSLDKSAVMHDPLVRDVVEEVYRVAREHEEAGEWIDAYDLMRGLHVLYEDDGRYKKDHNRLSQRLLMLQFYTPEILHDMRSAQMVADGEEPLPPFNPIDGTWHDKLDGVNERMILEPLSLSATYHVDEVAGANLLLGGLRGVETMVNTPDLAKVFPNIADDLRRQSFLGELTKAKKWVEDRRGRVSLYDMITLVRTITRANKDTVNIASEAILREFGNGAMSELDPFSSIIWPDEVSDFRRSTDGNFTGVGVQITLNELRELQVVTPLSGTPASRAGMRAGDIIRKVDGEQTLGITLNQAVDRITGPKGTPVILTVERTGHDDPIIFELKRDTIPVYATKGWERSGPGEQDWNYYIDSEQGIGYLRLTQFNSNTTKELRRAINQMHRERDLNGMIVDLRYNPGGLLPQAVSVANFFLKVPPRGERIVTQEDKDGNIQEEHFARPAGSVLPDVPLVVLVNAGSASASEIVAGALQDYDRAIIVGERSFGKGSVQNVYTLRGGLAQFKLTTHFYKLPSGRTIHRSPLPNPDGKPDWGIEPDVMVEMLPQQISDALTVRQDADVIAIDEHGNAIEGVEAVDPVRLVTEGIDPQLETALLLLRSKIAGEQVQAALPAIKGAS